MSASRIQIRLRILNMDVHCTCLRTDLLQALEGATCGGMPFGYRQFQLIDYSGISLPLPCCHSR